MLTTMTMAISMTYMVGILLTMITIPQTILDTARTLQEQRGRESKKPESMSQKMDRGADLGAGKQKTKREHDTASQMQKDCEFIDSVSAGFLQDVTI